MHTTDDLFAQALAQAQAGKLRDAHATYLQILQIDPGSEDARYRVAVVDLMQGNMREGAARLRQCLEARPDDPEILFSLARACQAMGLYDEARERFAAGTRLAPDRADMWSGLGDVLYLSGDADAALRAYTRARDITPRDPRIHVNIANAHARLAQHGPAIAAARNARDLAPERPEVAFALANALRGAGQLEEALEVADAILARTPGNVQALTCKAEILDRKGASGAAAEILLPIMRAGEVSPALARACGQVAVNRDQSLVGGDDAVELIDRCLAGARVNRFELRGLLFLKANLLQAMGDTARAFEACRAANEAAGVAYDRAATDARFAAYKRVFAPERIAALPRVADTGARPLFIVGLPRSGTTLVEQILDSHRDIAGGGERDGIPRAARAIPDYPRGLATFSAPALQALAGEYTESMETISADARFVTDKMPVNTEHLGLISRMFADARVIHVRRHPLAIGLSCYFQNFRFRNEFTFSLEGFAHYYRHTDRLMRHWAETLALPIHAVRYEDLVADPRPAIEGMLAFCGLEWDESCLAFDRNRRFVDTLSYAQVRKPLSREPAERHLRFAEQLRPLAEELAPEIAAYEAGD